MKGRNAPNLRLQTWYCPYSYSWTSPLFNVSPHCNAVGQDMSVWSHYCRTWASRSLVICHSSHRACEERQILRIFVWPWLMNILFLHLRGKLHLYFLHRQMKKPNSNRNDLPSVLRKKSRLTSVSSTPCFAAPFLPLAEKAKRLPKSCCLLPDRRLLCVWNNSDVQRLLRQSTAIQNRGCRYRRDSFCTAELHSRKQLPVGWVPMPW